MLKSSTGTDRSDHTVTCASTAVAEALLIENSVVNPFGLLRSTSKYGRSSVAAGTASMVQMTAPAGTTAPMPHSRNTPGTSRFISLPPCLGKQPRKLRRCYHQIEGRTRGAASRAPRSWKSVSEVPDESGVGAEAAKL